MSLQIRQLIYLRTSTSTWGQVVHHANQASQAHNKTPWYFLIRIRSLVEPKAGTQRFNVLLFRKLCVLPYVTEMGPCLGEYTECLESTVLVRIQNAWNRLFSSPILRRSVIVFWNNVDRDILVARVNSCCKKFIKEFFTTIVYPK